MASHQALDHLIIFVPANPTTKLPEVPKFFSENFTISPGGFHADGITSNVLILLSDGCYIELISFVDQSAVPKHWWGPDASFVGWKDWCLTNSKSPEGNFEAVKETHDPPVHGGRTRPDGVEVKWAVTFPKGELGGQKSRGRVPFFCHDITPRFKRVPITEESARHSCGAVGVHELTIIVKDESVLAETKKALGSIMGVDQVDESFFQARRVHNVAGLSSGPVISLRLPKTQKETLEVEEKGFKYGDVVLASLSSDPEKAGKRERLDGAGEVYGFGGVWVEYVTSR